MDMDTIISRWLTMIDCVDLSLHEEWPLGKLFLPSVMTAGSPVHLMSGLEWPSGKQRQKKSGRGLPVIV